MYAKQNEKESMQKSSIKEWSGSGFALNNGFVVTNYHVIENAKSIRVQVVVFAKASPSVDECPLNPSPLELLQRAASHLTNLTSNVLSYTNAPLLDTDLAAQSTSSTLHILFTLKHLCFAIMPTAEAAVRP